MSQNNDFDFSEPHNADQNIPEVINDNKLLKVNLTREHMNTFNTDTNILKSEPLPVTEDTFYNYTITAEVENLSSLIAYVGEPNLNSSYLSSKQILPSVSPGQEISSAPFPNPLNGTKYNNLVSESEEQPDLPNIFTIAPGSEIFTEIDILKRSNYTLAIYENICETCAPMNVTIVSNNGSKEIIERESISSYNKNSTAVTDATKNNNSQSEWRYIDILNLEPGHYKIKIYSDSQRNLDSVILYSSANSNETIDDLFNPPDDVLAHISEYTKVDPTRYIVKITNATKPIFLSFAESYDPLWSAYTTNIKNNKSERHDYGNSIPLYSTINGFYIDKLGDYTLTIEYKPQLWFIQGGVLSIATIMLAILVYSISRKNGILVHLTNLKMKFLR